MRTAWKHAERRFVYYVASAIKAARLGYVFDAGYMVRASEDLLNALEPTVARPRAVSLVAALSAALGGES